MSAPALEVAKFFKEWLDEAFKIENEGRRAEAVNTILNSQKQILASVFPGRSPKKKCWAIQSLTRYSRCS